MMVYEAKVVCCFCQHDFWTILETDTPCGPDQLFEVECPLNRSRFLFRLLKERKAAWGADWIYQAAEWRPVERPGAPQPIAIIFTPKSE
jgi:hypothetical protein